MKRSDLFRLYKILWEFVGMVSIILTNCGAEYRDEFLAMAGIAVLWAILMKMEEGKC